MKRKTKIASDQKIRSARLRRVRDWFLPDVPVSLAPSDGELEALSAQHTEISHTVRNILHVLSGVCLFCVIALASPDANLVASPTITIPILNYPVKYTAFLIVGPMLIGGLTLYLHVFYASLLQLENRLTLTDSDDSDRRQPAIRKAAAVFNVDNWAGATLTWFLFYWAPPLVLGLFAWRAIPLDDEGPVAFSLAAILALVMIVLQIRRCRPPWRRWTVPPLLMMGILTSGMLAATIVTGRVVVQRQLDLVKADLSGKDLRDLNLRGALLEEAKLTGADLRRAMLADADLKNANLQQVTLTEVDFTGANLQGADFTGSMVAKETVRLAKNWILAKYDEARWEELGLTQEVAEAGSKKDLRSADLSDIKLSGPGGLDLRSADLSKFNLRGVRFGKANLAGAKLRDAQLQDADFTQATGLTNDQIREGRSWFLALLDKNLGVEDDHVERIRRRDLKRMSLAEMDLRGANLAGFDLQDANLSGADLTDAVFHVEVGLQSGMLETRSPTKAQSRAFPPPAQAQESQPGDLFQRANLQGANLQRAKISPSSVQQANNWMLASYDENMIGELRLETDHPRRLEQKDFSGLQYLFKGNFFAVDLSEWNLSASNLTASNLAGVRLNGTALQKAILVRANLTEALLANANVKGADLTDAFLSCEQLKQMTGWQEARRSPNLLCSPDVKSNPSPEPPVPTPVPTDRSKIHVNLITLGQTGSGKTTLVSAITKVLASSDPSVKPIEHDSIHNGSQKGRGLQPAWKPVEFSTSARHYALADSPSHRDLMVLMITGASRAAGFLLVVSAVDGVSPETREQVRMARLSGISHAVVFLNKMDLKEVQRASAIETDVRGLLKSNGFDSAPIIRGSALGAARLESQWVGRIKDLLAALDTEIPPPRSVLDQPFLMPVEDVFSITGRGTVLTGRVERGRVRVGETVDILGFTSKTSVKILGIEMFRKLLNEGLAGDNLGLLLESVTKQEIERGQVVSNPGSMLKAAKRFRAEVYFLTAEEGGRQSPVFSGYRPQFYFRTTDITGTVQLERSGLAQPGGIVTMSVELAVEVALETGTRFAIREGGRTVGAGFVTQVLP